jgi:hypothetical protein
MAFHSLLLLSWYCHLQSTKDSYRKYTMPCDYMWHTTLLGTGCVIQYVPPELVGGSSTGGGGGKIRVSGRCPSITGCVKSMYHIVHHLSHPKYLSIFLCIQPRDNYQMNRWIQCDIYTIQRIVIRWWFTVWINFDELLSQLEGGRGGGVTCRQTYKEINCWVTENSRCSAQ